MKDELKKIIEEMITHRWIDQYELLDVIQHQYGFSLIFRNKKSNNRFSPTILPSQLVYRLVVQNFPEAYVILKKEIETAFEKERISG